MSDLVPHLESVPKSERPHFAVGRPILTIDVDDARLHISTEHITWFLERPDKLTIHFAGGSSLDITPTVHTRDQIAAVVKTLSMVLNGESPIRGALR